MLARLVPLSLAMALGCKDPEVSKPAPSVVFRVDDERFGPRLEAAHQIANADAKDKALRAIALDAAAVGNLEVVRKSLENMTDTQRMDAQRAAIKLAAENGEGGIALDLLNKLPLDSERDELAGQASDLLAKAHEGRAALDVAKLIHDPTERDKALVRLADQTNDGITALMKAARRGKIDQIKTALDAGLDLHERDRYGNTALLYASRRGHAGIVRYLLDKGAHPDTKNDAGMTPLMAASEMGHLDCVQVLLEKGANVAALNAEGKSAEILATAAGRKDIAEVLRKKAAKP